MASWPVPRTGYFASAGGAEECGSSADLGNIVSIESLRANQGQQRHSKSRKRTRLQPPIGSERCGGGQLLAPRSDGCPPAAADEQHEAAKGPLQRSSTRTADGLSLDDQGGLDESNIIVCAWLEKEGIPGGAEEGQMREETRWFRRAVMSSRGEVRGRAEDPCTTTDRIAYIESTSPRSSQIPQTLRETLETVETGNGMGVKSRGKEKNPLYFHMLWAIKTDAAQ
ncbi:hypothetical protein N7532_012122 [Penicillium argentinense]|uniref:Uncharacterized protein n=1 Tax=Penicillium argentinense TaxID=1131581 RepID=A0A9W9EJW2_9EURO|nr:uncharacterized protein N7532_012122 [Penicillium argentinense]KAJ5083079.1 hypothetical protein N7532_012122 [Penicillium argentinense]